LSLQSSLSYQPLDRPPTESQSLLSRTKKILQSSLTTAATAFGESTTVDQVCKFSFVCGSISNSEASPSR
jgi:hypothetical protein